MIDYDPHHWRDHLIDYKGSMLGPILSRVAFFVIWAALVTAARDYIDPLSISPLAHQLVGLALGLLLVFRTNASYERFWEGRKLWGSIVNETRNLARAAGVWLRDDPELVTRIIRWTVAFPWATMHALRGSTGLAAPSAAAALPAAELEAVLRAQHTPLAVARQITALIALGRQRGLISDYLQGSLDQNVQQLVDYMGGCERIQKTPLPFAYVVHLRRALILYCLGLPFALLEDFGWWTVPVTFLISYILVGIEEIGVECENPFGTDDNDLPLEDICATIEKNLVALIPADTQS